MQTVGVPPASVGMPSAPGNAEVIVEGAVFLHHDDHVLDLVDAGRRRARRSADQPSVIPDVAEHGAEDEGDEQGRDQGTARPVMAARKTLLAHSVASFPLGRPEGRVSASVLRRSSPTVRDASNRALRGL